MKKLLTLAIISGVFSFVSTSIPSYSYANNAGSTRQSCKKGYAWNYQLEKCVPKGSLKSKKNKIIFTE